MAKDSASGNRLIANNKKAYYDYFIEDKIEAGMELCGTEVKSIRQGKCSIKESYIQIINGEVFAINMNITPYEKGLTSLLGSYLQRVTHLFRFRFILSMAR